MRRRNYSREKQAWVTAYKAERGCADCGEMDPVVLEFDHLDPTTKDPRLRERPRATLTNLSRARMEAEAAKCDVVCANCHRRRTARRRLEQKVG